MGNRLQEDNILDAGRDVFYLTKQELFGIAEGTAASLDIKNTIALRKEEFAKYHRETPADRFDTFGPPAAGNSFSESLKSGAPPPAAKSFSGTGCCGGVVRAEVRLVHDPAGCGDLDGCILAAERTDPGWAPLFTLVKGILVERGSPLSHSAIVAREMGIPAIVGIEGLMSTLRDGQTVEMDGTTGKVRIVEETPPELPED